MAIPLFLERVRAGFAGTDAHDLFEVGNENLAVADLAGVGGLFDGSTTRSSRSSLTTLRSSPWAGNRRCIPRRDRARCGPSGAEAFHFGDGHPLDAVTDKASLTSSSLKGLMIAVTSFMVSFPV